MDKVFLIPKEIVIKSKLFSGNGSSSEYASIKLIPIFFCLAIDSIFFEGSIP